MKKTLAISGVYLDIYGTNFPFDEGLTLETQTVGDTYCVSQGGSGVIFSSAMKALGEDARLIGAIGNDELSTVLNQKLEQVGLSEHIIRDGTHSTNISFNMTNPKGKNILLSVGNANYNLQPETIEQKVYSLLEDTDLLYLGSVFKLPQLHHFFEKLLPFAKEKGIITVLDHGRVPSQVTHAQKSKVKQLITLVDYYVPNRYEFLDMWSHSNIDDSLSLLQLSAKNTTVIVTKDVDGAYAVLPDGNVHTTSTRDISVVNTIGSGDTFNAGLAYKLMQGVPIFEAMDFAQRCSEFKIENNHYPSASDIV